MFAVHILGASAAVPTRSRRPTAQVVEYNDRYYLVDCSEGTQMQILKYRIRMSRVDAIFISHMHGDHILGLPGLLTSLSLYGRNTPLKLIGPRALKETLEFIFQQTQSFLVYELEYIATEDFEAGDVIYAGKKMQVRLIPLEHRIFCRGFRFEEINKQPKFDFYKAKSLEIPNEYFRLLKQGNTIQLKDGREITPDKVCFPPVPPLSYAFCSDTRFKQAVIDQVKDCTLIYHESTFEGKMTERAFNTYHSTTLQAAEVAKQAGVKHLILGHFSARYSDLEPLLKEAQTIFPDTSLAIEGRVFKVEDYYQ